MYIDSPGYVDNELITDIIERALQGYVPDEDKKQVSRQILEGLEDLLGEDSY